VTTRKTNGADEIMRALVLGPFSKYLRILIVVQLEYRSLGTRVVTIPKPLLSPLLVPKREPYIKWNLGTNGTTRDGLTYYYYYNNKNIEYLPERNTLIIIF